VSTSQVTRPVSAGGKRAALVATAALAVAGAVLGLHASEQHSATFDEPTFVTYGLSLLQGLEVPLETGAPPLWPQLVAAPLRLLGAHASLPPQAMPLRAYAIWTLHGGAGLDARTALRYARLPVIIAFGVLIACAAAWAWRLSGPGAAVATAASLVSTPNLLAHGSLTTTDLGCALFMFSSMWLFQRAVSSRRWRDWFWLGVSTGLAILSKFTSLLLGPIFVVIIVALAVLRDARLSAARIISGAACAAAACVATTWLGAGGSFAPVLLEIGRVYAGGTEGYPFYLLGELSVRPWWHYHLVAWALKTPLAAILLLLLALPVLARRPERRDLLLFVVLPAVAIFGVSCFDRANLGVRRVLPALPLLAVVSGLAVTAPRPALRALAVALGLWAGVEALRYHPHELTYFNELAGGPLAAPYLLDDSNVDWGQDLPALAAWQRLHPEAKPLRLAYFGGADPRAYGVDAQPFSVADITSPPSGWYAIGLHALISFRRIPGNSPAAADWLRRFRPVDRAGYSIWIYRIGAGP